MWRGSDDVNDEVGVVQAMYPDELSLSSWPPVLTLNIDEWEARIELTSSYPEEFPSVHIKPPLPLCEEGELEELVATVLSQVTLNEPLLVSLFQILCDEIGSKHVMLKHAIAEQRSAYDEEVARLRELEDRQLAHDLAHKERSRAAQEAAVALGTHEEEQLPRFDFSHAGIRTGEPVKDRKSTFLAFLWPVTSREDVNRGLAILKANSKIARATHNMLAWRLLSPATGSLISECDSDGEGGAGGGLHQLLHNTGAENVAVLVSRWYGGIHLGPDRFKHINNCARSLLVREGYVEEGKKSGKRK